MDMETFFIAIALMVIITALDGPLDRLALFLARPRVTAWLIRCARWTPYTHIKSADGKKVYMWRYWLFNPYPEGTSGQGWRFPVSIRLHHICEPDRDRHLHDHPWNARSFILRGHYVELREDGKRQIRAAGTTATLRHGEYHKIDSVSEGGVWTLFVTYKYRGTWGFKVNGHKIPHKLYRPGACMFGTDLPEGRVGECSPGTCVLGTCQR